MVKMKIFKVYLDDGDCFPYPVVVPAVDVPNAVERVQILNKHAEIKSIDEDSSFKIDTSIFYKLVDSGVLDTRVAYVLKCLVNDAGLNLY